MADRVSSANDNRLSNMIFHQSTTTAAASKLPICNPYVKTYLLPDRSSHSIRKTRAKIDTLNPVFNDLLSYIVDSKDWRSRTLC